MSADCKEKVASDGKIKDLFMRLWHQYLFIKIKTIHQSILQMDDTDGPLSVH